MSRLFDQLEFFLTSNPDCDITLIPWLFSFSWKKEKIYINFIWEALNFCIFSIDSSLKHQSGCWVGTKMNHPKNWMYPLLLAVCHKTQVESQCLSSATHSLTILFLFYFWQTFLTYSSRWFYKEWSAISVQVDTQHLSDTASAESQSDTSN